MVNHSGTKITEEEKINIILLKSSGLSIKTIVAQVGRNKHTVRRILREYRERTQRLI